MRELTRDECGVVCGGGMNTDADLYHDTELPPVEVQGTGWVFDSPALYSMGLQTTSMHDGIESYGGTAADLVSSTFTKTGMGQEIDSLVNKSSTLESAIIQLLAKGWHIVPTTTHATQAVDGFIYINTNQHTAPVARVAALAHEVGHAMSTAISDAEWASQTSYVNEMLKSEAYALIINIDTHRQLAQAGISIPILASTANLQTYNQIYDAHRVYNLQGCINQIALIWGSAEHVDVKGTPANKYDDVTYADYYKDGWAKAH